jgi:hypothetical protein
MEIWDEISNEKDPRKLLILGKRLWQELETMEPSELLSLLKLISENEYLRPQELLMRRILERLGPNLVELLGSNLKLPINLVWFVETQIWVIPSEVPDPPFGEGVDITGGCE